MKTISASLLGSVLLAGTSLAHVAVLPPMPDRALTPNSTDAPAGCKLLPSDKGWPADSKWHSAFPDIYKKTKGTYGPDWMLQAKTVEDVQKGVNFARDNNMRLTIISTGHDFLGRETGRSGLRIDMAAMREPTVFTNEWKCGNTLKPTTHQGKSIDFENIQACRVAKNKRSVIPGRAHEFHYFEKRDGWDCDRLMRHKKRQHEGMGEGMSSMSSKGGMPAGVATHNVIKPIPGVQAYARVSGGMYNEMFYTQAADSGLMTLGAQHGGVSVTGGWMQAGGHNPFANKFGMQVDNVVEIEVVTADGKFHKVSDCNNPELFWALRGGGGSTYGVVTGLTVKVYPTFPVTVSRFFVNSTSKDGIVDATSWFLQNGAKLRDHSGMQGYFYVYRNSFQSVLHMPDDFSKIENAKNATEFMMKKMEELAGTTTRIEPKYYQYKTYKDWYAGEYGNEETEEKGELFLSFWDGSDGTAPGEAEAMMNPYSVIPWYLRDPQYPEKRKRSVDSTEYHASFDGIEGSMNTPSVMRSQPIPRHYLDSRLLSDEQVNRVPLKELSKAINDSMPNIDNIHWRGFLYGGGEMGKKDPESTGLLPQWRNATFHFIVNAVAGAVRHDYNVQPLAKLFPDAGAYVNEVCDSVHILEFISN